MMLLLLLYISCGRSTHFSFMGNTLNAYIFVSNVYVSSNHLEVMVTTATIHNSQ